MKKIWTFKEFFKHSKTEILGLGHRNNPSIITIDRLLEKYETIPKNEGIEKHFILAILSACNNYLEYVRINKPKGSKRQTSVEMLRQQILARLDEILLANNIQERLMAQKSY